MRRYRTKSNHKSFIFYEHSQESSFRNSQKDVIIHKFTCKITIEEKINKLQNSKCQVATNAFNDNKHIITGLTFSEYKVLFDI